MASGKLGSASLAATTNTAIYTCPTLKVATVNVNIVNRNTRSVTIRLAIGAASPEATDWIEYDATIPANGVLERSGLVMSGDEVLVAYSSATNVTVRAFGFEE